MSASMDAVGPMARTRAAVGWISLLLGGACAAILAAQVVMIRRINVNWDEFYFLTHVHSLLRGELSRTFQMAYTHLFTWLPAVGDEMSQILAARGLMFLLFAISAVMVARLASRWASLPASLLALLCFLAASPVMRHAASFRADSLLLPLILAAAILATRPQPSRRTDMFAGVCFGVALAVSIKAALFAPMLALLAIFSHDTAAIGFVARARVVVTRWMVPAAITLGVFAAILLLHTLTLPGSASDTPANFAGSVARKTLSDDSSFARWYYFRATLNQDLATWLFIGIGAVIAAVRRKWAAAACVLALLPVAFYRNSFPYFYVLMLAPASVLAALALDEITRFASARRGGGEIVWLPLVLAAPLGLQAFVNSSFLLIDRQLAQREIIAAVHVIFPRPVPYLDHSGMIASFPKVNNFMSGWGMDNYRSSPPGYIRNLLRTRRPPLLLANRGEIDPTSPTFRVLREEDRKLIEQFYHRYWGPVWIAGARTKLPAEGEVQLEVPYPGSYRVAANVPVVIDGKPRSNGDIVTVDGETCTVARQASPQPNGAPGEIALVTAEAQAPPQMEGAYWYVYWGL